MDVPRFRCRGRHQHTWIIKSFAGLSSHLLANLLKEPSRLSKFYAHRFVPETAGRNYRKPQKPFIQRVAHAAGQPDARISKVHPSRHNAVGDLSESL